jgi:hypothetical protein
MRRSSASSAAKRALTVAATSGGDIKVARPEQAHEVHLAIRAQLAKIGKDFAQKTFFSSLDTRHFSAIPPAAQALALKLG